jgi:hypothetical protein
MQTPRPSGTSEHGVWLFHKPLRALEPYFVVAGPERHHHKLYHLKVESLDVKT